MAIQFVGSQSGFLTATTGTQTVTFALAGGLSTVPAAGDLVLVNVGIGSISDLTFGVSPASGYTEIAELYSNDIDDANQSVSWKRMGATPDTTVALTNKVSSNNSATFTIFVFRGVDPTTPFDVTSTTSTRIDTGSVVPAAITPVTSGAWIVVSGVTALDYPGAAPGYSSDLTSFRSIATNAGNDSSVRAGAGYYSGWTSGAYTPSTWVLGNDSTSNSSTSVTVALRPERIFDNLTTTSLTTGTPVVSTISFSQQQVLTPSAITTGSVDVSTMLARESSAVVFENVESDSPVVGALAFSVKYNLTTTNLQTNSPTLSALGFAQGHALSPVSVVLGAPTVPSTTFKVVKNFTATSTLLGNPTISSVTLSQKYNLHPVSLVTSKPVVSELSYYLTYQLQTSEVETATPTIGSIQTTQKIAMPAVSIVAGTPYIGGLTWAVRVFEPNKFSLERLRYLPAESARVLLVNP